MKRIYILLLMLTAIVYTVNGQSCEQAVFYTEPATFTAEDQVTLFVDLSSCDYLNSLADVYLWMFVPDGPGPDGVGGNGDFCNGSNPEMVMNNEGDGLWSFTFVPTSLFAATPSTIGDQIGFIPKEFAACKGNGDQTVDLFLTVDPLEFVPSEARTFPSKFGSSDFITLYFDQNLTSNQGMANLDELFVYTWVNGQADGISIGDVAKVQWGEVGNTPELQMMNEGNGIYSLTLDLKTFYPVPEGTVITQVNYIVRSADGSVQSDSFSASPVELD